MKCAGCGLREPFGKTRRIRKVSLTIGAGSSWREETHTEQLCADCTDAIKVAYFNVNIAGRELSLPTVTETARRAS